MTSEEQFLNLLEVLSEYKSFRFIFTKANADTNGRIINRMINNYVEENRERCIAFTSMG